MPERFVDALNAARGLKSEHGENSEYDRALCELISDVYGLSREGIARELEIADHWNVEVSA